MFPKNPSVAEASREAAILNASMGSVQLIAGAFTGNLGFLGEALHNLGDSISFGAKAKALESTKEKVRKLRLGAAAIFFAGGVGGVASGIVELSSSKIHENASIGTIGVAAVCATLNTVVAKRTHRSIKNEETGLEKTLCCHDHHLSNDQQEKHSTRLDTKLHALTDAWTGWIYVAGLALHAKITGQVGSEVAVLANGLLAGTASLLSFRRKNESLINLD